jgi:hypothetical protein
MRSLHGARFLRIDNKGKKYGRLSEGMNEARSDKTGGAVVLITPSLNTLSFPPGKSETLESKVCKVPVQVFQLIPRWD